MISHVRHSNASSRDSVIILLSAKAGLRACEIAGLEWSMLLDARGRVGRSIVIEDVFSTGASGRRVPLHKDLRDALLRLKRNSDDFGPVVRSSRGGPMKPNSIVNWFVELFAELGFEGCSSHSGRRTFITSAARSAHKSGGCLRDVQLLAGHRSIAVTQGRRRRDRHTASSRQDGTEIPENSWHNAEDGHFGDRCQPARHKRVVVNTP